MFQTHVHAKKTALIQGGFLVYPLGLEPKLDGVGGRNVIQLHYEYVYFFAMNRKALLIAKEIPFGISAVQSKTVTFPITLRVRVIRLRIKSISILLFLHGLLQAFPLPLLTFF